MKLNSYHNIIILGSSPDFLPPSPDRSTRSVYHTAPNSINCSELSPNFDTTADEMMLFEVIFTNVYKFYLNSILGADVWRGL